MKVKALLYDFDGVIKESTQIKTNAFYKMYLPFGQDTANKAKEHHLQNGGISRFEKFKLYHDVFLGIKLSEKEIQDLATEFSRIVLKDVIECDYVKGALQSISVLSKDYKQFIVTGTPQNEIEYIMNELNIAHLFHGIFGSPEHKINISSSILKKENFKAQEVVFIGDAWTDYDAASTLNLRFILREHEENADIFRDVNVLKIPNLKNLKETIEK